MTYEEATANHCKIHHSLSKQKHICYIRGIIENVFACRVECKFVQVPTQREALAYMACYGKKSPTPPGTELLALQRGTGSLGTQSDLGPSS